jgi:hypothetical protein
VTLQRALLVCPVLLVSVIAPAGEALACVCAPVGSPCAAIEHSDAVIFSGTALEVSRPGGSADLPASERLVRVRFSVNELFRGASDKTMVVSTPDESGMCGYEFQAGESYLVFARLTAQGVVTSVCSRTTHLSAAQDDLEVLHEAAQGGVRSRLHGRTLLLMARMNGALIPAIVGGLPDIKVVARTGSTAQETITDETGAFRFIGLEPGRYMLRVAPNERWKPMFDREVTAQLDGCSAEADLLLTPPSLSGTVRRLDGSPARDLRITVVDVGRVSASDSVITFTDAEGRWTIDGLRDGRYLVGLNVFQAPSARSPFPPLWYPGVAQAGKGEEIALRDQRPRQLDLTLPAPLPRRTIRGLVLNASGQPVQGAMVSLIDVEFPNQEAGEATSDAQGRFTIEAVEGRQVSVRARIVARGGGASDEVRIAGESGDSAVTLTLSQTGQLSR